MHLLFSNRTLIVFLSILLQQISMLAQPVRRTTLNADWRFQLAMLRNEVLKKDDLGQGLTNDWYKTQLPNTVLNALLQQNVIEDPFYRTNESRLQWLEKKDWIFEKTFDVSPEVMRLPNHQLVFEGLDTYAEVYLNDFLVISGDNMFRTWHADVRNILKEKGNILKIYFTSPLSKEKKLMDNAFVEFPDGTRMHTRKAQFHYGWDWGPRFVTCGIQNAFIESWADAKISDIYLKNSQISAEKALVDAYIDIVADKSALADIHITFGTQTATQRISLQEGDNSLHIPIQVAQPKLWWTHNLGTPFLYDVEVKIVSEGREWHAVKRRHGIRNIRLVQNKDAKGETFYFELNGRPIFAKGANMIPIKFFQENVTEKDYDKILFDAVEGNMNMLRIWGGGIYQPDIFYDKCDEKGILIWQDFMFACAMYPSEDKFLETTTQEALEQVKRLRSHACLALWCGNNEINEAWHNWGWQPRYNPDQKAYIWKAYEDIFLKMLPDVVGKHSDITYYESSPRFGRYNPKSYTEGDAHDWFVWHDERPFEHYEQNIPRFMSEYGFQSFPNWQTIESFSEEADRSLESPVMLLHQKHPRGNKLMKKYMESRYNVPKSFKNFVYVSQLVQAEGISKAIEAHRRHRPYCMGSLYWQLNDVWPVASWSSTDSRGQWKALHYFARTAFDNLMISAEVKNDSLKITVVNDGLDTLQGDLIVQVMDFRGRVSFLDGRYVYALPEAASVGYHYVLNEMLKSEPKNETLLYVTFKPQNGKTQSKLVFLTPPKDLVLPPKQLNYSIKSVEGGLEIRLSSPFLQKNVQLSADTEGWFSDNYFDLMPQTEKVIFYKTTATKEAFEAHFEWECLNGMR